MAKPTKVQQVCGAWVDWCNEGYVGPDPRHEHHLTLAESRELEELVDIVHLLREAAYEPPPLSEDPIARMLGII